MGHYFMSMSALSSQITNSCLALSSFIGLSGHAIEDKSFAHLYIQSGGGRMAGFHSSVGWTETRSRCKIVRELCTLLDFCLSFLQNTILLNLIIT